MMLRNLAVALTLITLMPSSGQSQASLRSAGPETRPKMISSVDAIYPPSLRAAGISGAVFVQLLVAPSGKVESVVVINKVHPLMDTAASEAARQWVYEPAKYRDVPVYSVVYTGIGFRRIE